MTLSKDMVAASTTPLILSILHNGDSYGYAIIALVKELSNGEYGTSWGGRLRMQTVTNKLKCFEGGKYYVVPNDRQWFERNDQAGIQQRVCRDPERWRLPDL